MKKYVVYPLLALSGGAAAFFLRFLQVKTGFEADTGLPVAGNLYARLLPLLFAVLALLFLLLVRKLPVEKAETSLSFSHYFFTSGAALPSLLVTGLFLLLASGAYDLYAGLLLNRSVLELILGILSIFCAAFLFPVVSACRKQPEKPSRKAPPSGNLLLAPVLLLVIRLVLTYRADSINPSLSAYYVEILALSFLLLGFYRLSSFAFHSGNTRRFALYAMLSLVFTLATLADRHGVSAQLLYCGCVLLQLAFLLLRFSALIWMETPTGAGD